MSGVVTRALLLALASVVSLIGLACLERPAPRADRDTAPGSDAVSLTTEDGLTLHGRLWLRDTKRVIVYLHEYRGNQSAWWPTVGQGTPDDPSALTLDLRGHGMSEGKPEDLEGVARDAAAAIAFARERGFERVVIVGAGMGAAAGMIAAAGDPRVAVLGLSAPSEFAGMRAHEAARIMDQRLALIAAEGDLSARQSITDFRRHASIPPSRIVMLRGADHGEALLTGAHSSEAWSAFQRLLAELWQS
ncbi:MAG: alpha/beta fold hydrolase [Chloroflexi bacterium]|nr:alpha/beta fold hydrolase [Chloroflexota bacterium]